MVFKIISLLAVVAVVIKCTDAACCPATAVQQPLVLQTCPVLNYVPKTCGCPLTTCCDTPCSSCFKDLSNVCATCPEKQKPACACLKAAAKDSCGCDKDYCGCDKKAKSFIFFPEVEYPMTILEVLEPFYYNTCFGY